MHNFIKASKQSLRFNTTNGCFSSEDLWHYSLTSLDTYVVSLGNKLKSTQTESYIKPALPVDKEMQLQFDVAKEILEIRVADLDKARKTQITKAKNAKIREAIANKQDSVLQESSLEDLEKMLEEEES